MNVDFTLLIPEFILAGVGFLVLLVDMVLPTRWERRRNAATATTAAVGLAAVFLLGQVTSFSVFALNVVTLVGLGLGADYALFLVSRFREELGRGVEGQSE